MSDDRYVRYVGQNCDELYCDPLFNFLYTPSPDFSPFLPPASGNGQTSDVETGRLSGTASVSGYSDIGYSIGESVYDVAFDVATRTRIQLIGMVTSERIENFGGGNSRVQFFHRDRVLFDSSPIHPFAFDEVVRRVGTAFGCSQTAMSKC